MINFKFYFKVIKFNIDKTSLILKDRANLVEAIEKQNAKNFNVIMI